MPMGTVRQPCESLPNDCTAAIDPGQGMSQMGRDPVQANVSCRAAQLDRQVSGNEFSGLALAGPDPKATSAVLNSSPYRDRSGDPATLQLVA